MANTNTLDLVSLDPNQHKESLKTFLRSQEVFRDYDFDGSNLNMLLTILAHNTFKNAWYLNMNLAESFLDSAVLKASAISKAKELNYTPRSARSATSIITIEFATPSNTTFVDIPKGTSFTTVVGQTTYTFSTDENVRLYPNNSSNGSVNFYKSANISIYEGIYVSDSYVVNYTQEDQQFEISNDRVDTESVVVISYEDTNSINIPYLRATTLLGQQSDDPIYFIEQDVSERYKVVFGDDLIGRRPKNGAIVSLEYRISSGAGADGANRFVIDIDITNGVLIDDVVVTTIQPARGGAEAESLDSIKYYAPRHFRTQERAVTTIDYEILLKGQFPEINAVSVYGGDLVSPPQFGKVFVAVDIAGIEGFPTSKKNEYKQFLATKMPLSIQAEMVNPQFIYCRVETNVKYNTNVTTITIEDLKTVVQQAILDWSDEQLNDFNVTFRGSRFQSMIDDAHYSIISNETDISVYKKIIPTRLGVAENYSITFNVSLFKFSGDPDLLEYNPVRSSEFTFNSQKVLLSDNFDGTLSLVTTSGSVIVPQVGTIDYDNGALSLVELQVDEYAGESIKIYVTPSRKDITSSLSDIMSIESSEIIINVEQIKE